MSGELSDREMGNIARTFVRRSMRIGKGRGKYDAVRIVYNRTDQSCEKFTFKVEEECWRVGAHTLSLGYSSKRQKSKYMLSPEESLREMSPFAEAIARRADVMIFIGEEDEPNWARGLTAKIKLTAPIRERLHEITDRRRTRWAYFGWPVPRAARAYGCPVKRFRGIFFNSIRKTFTRELLKLCEFYRAALAGKNEVRIVADDGTDLVFRIKGRPVLVDDGMISREDLARGDVGVNIPAGEVFIAPLETSADGMILFERVAIPGFGKLEGLKLKFRKGKVYSINYLGLIFEKTGSGFSGRRRYFLDTGEGVEKCILGVKRTGGRFRIYENEVLVKDPRTKKIISCGKLTKPLERKPERKESLKRLTFEEAFPQIAEQMEKKRG